MQVLEWWESAMQTVWLVKTSVMVRACEPVVFAIVKRVCLKRSGVLVWG
jgi:hypothetical protein